jgi:hypothetical protein
MFSFHLLNLNVGKYRNKSFVFILNFSYCFFKDFKNYLKTIITRFGVKLTLLYRMMMIHIGENKRKNQQTKNTRINSIPSLIKLCIVFNQLFVLVYLYLMQIPVMIYLKLFFEVFVKVNKLK